MHQPAARFRLSPVSHRRVATITDPVLAHVGQFLFQTCRHRVPQRFDFLSLITSASERVNFILADLRTTLTARNPRVDADQHLTNLVMSLVVNAVQNQERPGLASRVSLWRRR